MSTRRFYILGFGILIIFDTLSLLSFKFASEAAEPFTSDMAWLMRVVFEPWVYGAVVGYLGAFATWMTVLRHAPVGPAYAASHLEVIGVMMLSVPLFGEHLTWLQLTGAALIILGVICLAVGEEKLHAKQVQ